MFVFLLSVSLSRERPRIANEEEIEGIVINPQGTILYKYPDSETRKLCSIPNGEKVLIKDMSPKNGMYKVFWQEVGFVLVDDIKVKGLKSVGL